MSDKFHEILFLSLDEVLAIHEWQIRKFGGSHGLRDRTLLESAVFTPRSTFDGEYLHADIIEMAAAYLFHLVENHPFIDGNKRVGAMSAAVFLDTNGYELTTNDEEFTAAVLQVASGKMGKSQCANFLRLYVSQIET